MQQMLQVKRSIPVKMKSTGWLPRSQSLCDEPRIYPSISLSVCLSVCFVLHCHLFVPLSVTLLLQPLYLCQGDCSLIYYFYCTFKIKPLLIEQELVIIREKACFFFFLNKTGYQSNITPKIEKTRGWAPEFFKCRKLKCMDLYVKDDTEDASESLLLL